MRSPMSLLRFTAGHRLPVVLQSEAAECGLACLAMVAGFHGHELDLNALRRRFAVSIKGMTMKTLLLMAQRLGMSGRGLRLEPAGLAKLRTPAILHLGHGAFRCPEGGARQSGHTARPRNRVASLRFR
jgi:ATP-binding cassette, subfamily B, bacterial CvaB/MchF/RaxB